MNLDFICPLPTSYEAVTECIEANVYALSEPQPNGLLYEVKHDGSCGVVDCFIGVSDEVETTFEITIAELQNKTFSATKTMVLCGIWVDEGVLCDQISSDTNCPEISTEITKENNYTFLDRKSVV